MSNISDRLSIPKLNSYGSKDRLEKYMNTQIKSPRAEQPHIKVQQQQAQESIRSIEKLMPTQPNFARGTLKVNNTAREIV